MTNGITDATLDPTLDPPAEASMIDAAGGGRGNGNHDIAIAENPMPGNIRPADIVGEMQNAYLDYAMSVIVARALPDVRDGLKPVHRRILYAMANDLYLTHNKPHRKSARIVGEVLGKYHPHGDVAVYDAMVRMAQDFSLRYPLVDGQGNFGSIDGDGAAAMRYTEARLAEISDLMLTDLEKDTVEWHDNFDNSLEEPDILPAALPNLLINGSSGIAVGMATNIPPHNLCEIVDALVYLIDRYADVEEITVDELLQFVKGPDFPTGGILYRFREDKANENTDVIAQGYSMGKARLIMQAKAHFEEMSRGRSRIVITELPYQTNKTALIERIATLARDTKIEGITDLRDESDRTGMRIVVELTRNAEPKDVLKDLFKYTPLQQTFGMQMLALVDGQPRLLSLKRALHLFVQHREVIIRRRSEYELAKARDRAHIVEGLLKALDILDEVIATIRRSQTVETARNNLVKNFKFTEIQAQAILDMQLRRLAAMERKKLQEEYNALLERIAYLEDLLAHPEKILAVIRQELLDQKEKYGDARRTQIVDRTKGTLTTTDLIPQQDVWVTVSADGELRRYDVTRLVESNLRQMAKHGEVAMLTANTRDFLYLFCRDGRCAKVPIHELPQNGAPKHVADLSEFTRRDTITSAVSIPRLSAAEPQGYLFMATALGEVKRVAVADVVSNANAEFTVMTVEPRDRLAWVLRTPGERDVMLFTAEGQSIRFHEEDVRSMGLVAGGVAGIKLKKKDVVIHADLVDERGEGVVVTMTTQGYAKRTALSEYSRQGRNGSGIITHKPTNRTGLVVAAMLLGPAIGDEELIAAITAKRQVKPITVGVIPMMGRGVQGKQVIEPAKNDQVSRLQRINESTNPADTEPLSGDGNDATDPPDTSTPPKDSATSNGSTNRGSTNGVVGKSRTRATTKRSRTSKAAGTATSAKRKVTTAQPRSRTNTQKQGKTKATAANAAATAPKSSTTIGRKKRSQATRQPVKDVVQQAALLESTSAETAVPAGKKTSTDKAKTAGKSKGKTAVATGRRAKNASTAATSSTLQLNLVAQTDDGEPAQPRTKTATKATSRRKTDGAANDTQSPRVRSKRGMASAQEKKNSTQRTAGSTRGKTSSASKAVNDKNGATKHRAATTRTTAKKQKTAAANQASRKTAASAKNAESASAKSRTKRKSTRTLNASTTVGTVRSRGTSQAKTVGGSTAAKESAGQDNPATKPRTRTSRAKSTAPAVAHRSQSTRTKEQAKSTDTTASKARRTTRTAANRTAKLAETTTVAEKQRRSTATSSTKRSTAATASRSRSTSAKTEAVKGPATQKSKGTVNAKAGNTTDKAVAGKSAAGKRASAKKNNKKLQAVTSVQTRKKSTKK